MRITAIICTYERYELLPRAITSLLRQDQAGEFDIVVVDNSSNRELALVFASRYKNEPNITFIYEETANLSNARNVGARAATGQVVAYIDDDAEASARWIMQVRGAFGFQGSDVACVGGPVEPIWQAPPPEWLTRRSLDMLSLIDWGNDLRELAEGEWLAGCNIAFRRDVLLEIGGFSPTLGRAGNEATLLGNEEYEVCEKILKMGKRVVYAPQAMVKHTIAPHRPTVGWLIKRMAWQAISDAVSNPNRSRKHAAWTATRFGRREASRRHIRYLVLMSGLKKRLSDDDLSLIYDKTNYLICGDT